MQKEMERELSFHPEIELIVKDANLSSEKQKEQVQELIEEKIDLLIGKEMKKLFEQQAAQLEILNTLKKH